MALLKELATEGVDGQNPKRHIVYPYYIIRGGGKATIILPAFPDWGINDINEARALVRASNMVLEYIQFLVRHGTPLPLPADGGKPERYSERRFIAVELAE